MPDPSISKRSRNDDVDRAVVRRLFERVYSKGELHLVDELVASDFVGEDTESPTRHLGPEGVRSHVRRLRTAFHGFTLAVDDLHLEGGVFEVSWTARGTHELRFLGIEPTCSVGPPGSEPAGTRIAVPGEATGTVRNGEILECRLVWDEAALRRQLGAPVADAGTDADARDSVGRAPPGRFVIRRTLHSTLSDTF